MKKRFLSLLLALSLTLAFLIPAYAADVPTAEKDIRALLNRPTTAAEIQSLEQAVQFLDEKGINQQMLTSIEKIDGKDTFVYQFDNNEVASCISYEALKNGDTLFNITEGNKHDTLLMKNNGEIFLNGNLVTFTEEVVETSSPESAISEIPGNPIAPCDGSSYNTTNCPYGSPSDYSKLGNTQYTSNVIFGNLIKNLTQASISLVLGKYLSDFNDILSYLSSIVSALGNDDPTSDAASFVRYYYTHATKGYYVSNSGGMHLGVYKVVFSCYSKPNYVGYLRSGIVYQCKTLY